MVTLIKYGAHYNTNVMEIRGLSTDTKPVGKIDGMSIPNGSIYTEIDTGVDSMYDEEHDTWYEIEL